MAIRYKVDILDKLKKIGFSSYKLRKDKIIGEAMIQKLRNGELISWSCINKICELLECQPGDILEYVDECLDVFYVCLFI